MRASRISLVVFAILFLLSFLLLSVAGDYWLWYLIMGCFAIPPIIIGPTKYRKLGYAALAISLVLIVSDLVGGRHLRERRHQIEAKARRSANRHN